MTIQPSNTDIDNAREVIAGNIEGLKKYFADALLRPGFDTICEFAINHLIACEVLRISHDDLVSEVFAPLFGNRELTADNIFNQPDVYTLIINLMQGISTEPINLPVKVLEALHILAPNRAGMVQVNV